MKVIEIINNINTPKLTDTISDSIDITGGLSIEGVGLLKKKLVFLWKYHPSIYNDIEASWVIADIYGQLIRFYPQMKISKVMEELI